MIHFRIRSRVRGIHVLHSVYAGNSRHTTHALCGVLTMSPSESDAWMRVINAGTESLQETDNLAGNDHSIEVELLD